MFLPISTIRERFQACGLRPTRQREIIYAALASAKSHPSADELLDLARHIDDELSLATVYNTLEALCDAGLARRLSAAGVGPCRFDADVSDHAHAVTPSGEVRDLPHDLSRQLLDALPQEKLDEVARRLGVAIERVNLQLVVRPAEPPARS